MKRGAPKTRSIASKKLIVADYRRRLKMNVKSLSDNFTQILQSSKISTDDNIQAPTRTGLVADHYTLCNEVSSRTALIAKAADELLKLTNDIREFLILRDFSFIGQAMDKSTEVARQEHAGMVDIHDRVRLDLGSAAVDIDRELNDNFGIKS